MGFTHMGARYYDPKLGRFLSPDPLETSESPYIYALDNPIMYIDPSGLTVEPSDQPTYDVINRVGNGFYGGIEYIGGLPMIPLRSGRGVYAKYAAFWSTPAMYHAQSTYLHRLREREVEIAEYYAREANDAEIEAWRDANMGDYNSFVSYASIEAYIDDRERRDEAKKQEARLKAGVKLVIKLVNKLGSQLTSGMKSEIVDEIKRIYEKEGLNIKVSVNWTDSNTEDMMPSGGTDGIITFEDHDAFATSFGMTEAIGKTVEKSGKIGSVVDVTKALEYGYNGTGLGAIAAHELGHQFGLTGHDNPARPNDPILMRAGLPVEAANSKRVRLTPWNEFQINKRPYFGTKPQR